MEKPDFEPKDFINEQLTFDIPYKKPELFSSSGLSVQELVGEIEPAMRRFGFTAGQFSLSNLIQYVLEKIGPSDLYISTWAASTDCLKQAFGFLENRKIKNIKFIIDTYATKYRDGNFEKIIKKYGDCIRTTRIHAKFVVMRNEKWNIVIRTSANLNRNKRLENFEIDDNKGFADFIQSFFDIAFKEISVNECHTKESSKKLNHIINQM